MKPAAAALMAVGLFAAPAAAYERVAFPSNDADIAGGTPTRLEALYASPAGPGPFAAIVFLHGCAGMYQSGGKLAARDAQWSEAALAAGYAVLHVDSFRPRGVRETCSRRDASIKPERERPRDAFGALVHLQARLDIRADRIAVFGWSHGAMTTVWTVVEGSDAKPASLPKGGFRAAVAFYPGCRSALSRKPAWRTRVPLAILAAELDDWTQSAPCADLVKRAAAAGDPISIRIYPGAYHDFDAPDMPVRTRENVASTRSGTATLGTDPAARADALVRVREFLRLHLEN